MTTARKQLISIEDTPYYHVITICFRRAFLAGYDKPSKTNFGHRRDWIVKRMMELSDIFSIHICSYSVMSNHYHIVLKDSENKLLGFGDKAISYYLSEYIAKINPTFLKILIDCWY